MKRLALSLVLALLGTVSARAQAAYPQGEIFAGVSYVRVTYQEGINLYGWQASPDWNVHKRVSVFLDFGGQYQRVPGPYLSSVYEYMIGPRLKYRTRRFTAFVHGMVGGDAANVTSFTYGGFAFGGGGGLDVNVGKYVALRVFQIDSIHDITRGVWGHRGAFGIVFKIGGAR